LTEPDDLRRIRSDLKKARERVAAIQAGAMGSRPTASIGPGGKGPLGGWETDGNKTGLPNGALAWSNQLKAREADVTRLERDYLFAMIDVWGVSRILEAMEGKPREPTPSDPAPRSSSSAGAIADEAATA
jgi:hypothetical protein